MSAWPRVVLLEDMLAEQAALARAVMDSRWSAPRTRPARTRGRRGCRMVWSAVHADPVLSAKTAIDEIEKAGGGWTFAKLTIANATLRELTAL